MKSLAALALVASLAAANHDAVAASSQLDDAQMKQLFARAIEIAGTGHGQTQVSYVADHTPDGKVSAQWGAGKSAGTWKVDGSEVCVTWVAPGWHSGCWHVQKSAGGYQFIDAATGAITVSDATIVPKK